MNFSVGAACATGSTRRSGTGAITTAATVSSAAMRAAARRGDRRRGIASHHNDHRRRDCDLHSCALTLANRMGVRTEQTERTSAAERSGRTGTITYQPALDGVRALAVAAVLLFHAEVPGFSGGYLGVSVFFTLSGYLITTLLLTEHATTGTISMPGFYARRVRRLLPASLVCLTAIVVVSELTDVFVGVAELRRQVM